MTVWISTFGALGEAQLKIWPHKIKKCAKRGFYFQRPTFYLGLPEGCPKDPNVKIRAEICSLAVSEGKASSSPPAIHKVRAQPGGGTQELHSLLPTGMGWPLAGPLSGLSSASPLSLKTRLLWPRGPLSPLSYTSSARGAKLSKWSATTVTFLSLEAMLS